MKKTLCIFLSFIILMTSFLALPVSSQAATYKPDRKIYAEAYMLINLDDDSYPVVARKNIDERLYPASLTKIVTAMVTLENVKDVSVKTKMSQAAYDASVGTGAQVAGITVGEELSVDTLLYLTMVHSACDACEVLAEFVGGTKENFVKMMNDWVKKVGCNDTNFTNPSGLHDDNHYTTARDMGIMAEYAMDLPRFMDIVSQTYHIVPATNMQEDRRLETTNLMMLPGYPDYYYQYVTGIKTGWHDQAGDCIVTTAKAEGYAYLCVAMGSPHVAGQNPVPDNGAMIDSKALYRWAFRTFTLKSIVDMEKPLAEVNLNLAWEKDTLLLVPEKDVTALLPNDVDLNSIVVSEVEKPESVNAPITKGEILGKATLSYANHELATINLVASEDVQRSDLLYYWEGAKNIISSPWFLGICGLFVLLFIIYLIIATIYNRRDRRKRKVKKYRKF